MSSSAGPKALRLISLHADPGVSGTTDITERPGLSAALADITAGNAEALVGARFDRLARDTLRALLIEQAVREAGGTIVYCEGFNGDEDGAQFVREVLHAVAAEQKRQLVARLRAGREAKRARGGFAGGRVRLGYRADRGELVPDEDRRRW